MKQEREAKRGGGRPRKPKLVNNADGTLSARMTIEVEGETVRKTVPLGTKDWSVAKKRLKRLAAGEELDATQVDGTSFQEYADELIEQSTLRSIKDRARRLRQFAYPIMGKKRLEQVNVRDVKAALALAEERLGWTMTVRHLKNDISAILGAAFGDQLIAENVALRVRFNKKDGALGGKALKRVVLPRIVLEDFEFEKLIAHGLTQSEGSLPELYMMMLSARCLGGMRTSDLHAWRWDHIDTAFWSEAKVPRPKTQGKIGEEGYGEMVLVPFELPSELVEHLSAWWYRHGCPKEGPVFPVRRGPRAGLHKGSHISYAEALRDELWAAGVVRPLPGFEQARPEDRRKLCALQSGTAGRRSAVDFHSFRRAWVTATTNEPGLSLGESMALADHSDPATHLRYRRDEKRRVIPAGVLPRLPQLPASSQREGGFGSNAAETQKGHSRFSNDSRCVRRDSNPRPTAPEADEGPSSPELPGVFGVSATSRHAQNRTHWQN